MAEAKAPKQPETGPGNRLLWTATALMVVELALLAALAARREQQVRLGDRVGRANSARMRAEEIRAAWAELAETGAGLSSRLPAGGVTAAQLKDHISAAGREAGLAVSVQGPEDAEAGKGLKASRFSVSGTGPEEKVLAFLRALGRSPALIDIRSVDLRGTARAQARIKIVLHHYALNEGQLDRLRAFAEALPKGTAPGGGAAAYRRSEPLFVPHMVGRDEALRGWPDILLSGFSEDEALMMVEGTAKSVGEGDTVTGDIVYTSKVAVNQAALKRGRDNSEIILTVGSRDYTLKPSDMREMSGFITNLQRRPRSSLLKGISPP